MLWWQKATGRPSPSDARWNLSAIFRLAKADGLIRTNPAEDLAVDRTAMAGTPKRDATISIEQYQQLVEAHPLPIVETEQGGSAVAYIYGPDGLIAMKSKALYFRLKDRQAPSAKRSTRRVHSSRVTTTFRSAESPGSEPALMRYLYTGQKLDSETGPYNYRTRLRCDGWSRQSLLTKE